MFAFPTVVSTYRRAEVHDISHLGAQSMLHQTSYVVDLHGNRLGFWGSIHDISHQLDCGARSMLSYARYAVDARVMLHQTSSMVGVQIMPYRHSLIVGAQFMLHHTTW